MAQRNYYQAKRQKEISRKTRQDKKAQRKNDRTTGVDPATSPESGETAQQPAEESPPAITP